MKDSQHYIRQRVTVNPATQCWEWNGSRHRQGYGQLASGRGERRAHRLAYVAFVGEIPDGLSVLHRCDNPCCCNPAHLFVGTQNDNVQDMRAKGRSPARHGEHSPGAKITQDQVIEIRERRAKGASVSELAAAFGLRKAEISSIATGRRWQRVGGPRTSIGREEQQRICQRASIIRASRDCGSKILPATVALIRQFAASGRSGCSIARELRLSASHVCRIIKGQARNHLLSKGAVNG